MVAGSDIRGGDKEGWRLIVLVKESGEEKQRWYDVVATVMAFRECDRAWWLWRAGIQRRQFRQHRQKEVVFGWSDGGVLVVR